MKAIGVLLDRATYGAGAGAEVDHVIPQTLVDKPDVLAKALAELGRPADFNLNSYENLLPACGPATATSQT